MENQDSPKEIRLSKRVAELFSCSRNIAQMYIEGGWVRVDGQIVEEPQFKVEGQTIELDVDARATPPRLVTLLVHKPAGQALAPLLDAQQSWFQLAPRSGLCSSEERALKRHFRRLQAPLPLAPEDSGLTVCTQDNSLFVKLDNAHPGLEQEYLVELQDEAQPTLLNQLQQSSAIGPYRRAEVKVSRQSEKRLRMVGKALSADAIRERLNKAGLQPVSIKRIRIGSVSMGKLASGEWRYLGENERF